LPADQMPVALVLRVHRYGGVAEHGFGTGGGDDQMITGAVDRVAEMPHGALFFLIQHLQVGDGGVECRVPVHQALAAIDQTLVVEAHEHFLHRLRQPRVHGEALPGPVHGGAQAADLAGDIAAGFRLPLPHFFEEFLPAQIVAADPFGPQLALHHHLGGDTGVVRTHLPQGVVALHAVVADQAIHDGVVEAVTHVQAAGDVGRRDHDAVGITLAGGLEVAALFPGVVPVLLDGLGVEGLVHVSGSPSGPARAAGDGYTEREDTAGCR